MHVSWLVRSERTSIIPKKRGSQTRLPTRTPLLLDEQRPQDRQHNHGSNNHADGKDQERFHCTRPFGPFKQLALFDSWRALRSAVHIVHDYSARTRHCNPPASVVLPSVLDNRRVVRQRADIKRCRDPMCPWCYRSREVATT